MVILVFEDKNLPPDEEVMALKAFGNKYTKFLIQFKGSQKVQSNRKPNQ